MVIITFRHITLRYRFRFELVTCVEPAIVNWWGQVIGGVSSWDSHRTARIYYDDTTRGVSSHRLSTAPNRLSYMTGSLFAAIGEGVRGSKCWAPPPCSVSGPIGTLIPAEILHRTSDWVRGFRQPWRGFRLSELLRLRIPPRMLLQKSLRRLYSIYGFQLMVNALLLEIAWNAFSSF